MWPSPCDDERHSLTRKLEALLFMSPQPVSARELASFLGFPLGEVESALEELSEHYAAGHGLSLLRSAGGWQMTTAPDLCETVGGFQVNAERLRLSRAALECLAIIAYNQPVTRPEIEEIRGVRSDRVIDTLLRCGLIKSAGRKKEAGAPILYRTTSLFLDLFGLNAIGDLPPLGEYDSDIEVGKLDEHKLS